MLPDGMWSNGMWSIGELAERAGVTVKTVRFYSDRGLLPEAARSSGGHRRYGPDALDQIRLIRSLRALDLPVPEVGRILDRRDSADGDLEDALGGAIARQLDDLGVQLTALRWREAALQLVHDCPPAERPQRLRLIGAVSVPPSTDALARFWRRWLPVRLPARQVSAILDHAVPQPPPDPTPEQVLAFARLHAFVTADCGGGDHCQPAAHQPDEGYRPSVLYDGLVEAFALAAPDLRAGRPPRAGEALDCFVAAYARACGLRDTPGFRHRLGGQLAADPRIDHYWQLVTDISGPAEPNPGVSHDWLRAALDAELALER
ncbi:MerR family transcriptional regulator [Streptomyces purpureus]|uniref:MerR family transcriptional regulator n=3 Tax=Streptomyces purpureus TaxID=1951 RepID=A0A918LMX5_9ACTN|nr:MerR family transcriptional regulator [Streptomyces purpureus]